MGISCQINLLKPPNNVFQPGDVVSGVIKYVLPAQMEFDRIVTSLKGSGVLEIRVASQNIYRGDDNIQSSNEKYVDIDDIVLNGKTKVPAGSYDVNFNFKLPYFLPSSFLYQNIIKQYRIFCRVKYYIRIKFERPGWFSSSKHFRKEICVLSGIKPTLLMQPVIYGKNKKLFTFFSKKKPIIGIKATIQNSVIPVGGHLHLDYEIKNDTNIEITSFEIKLVEVYTFKVEGHPKVTSEKDIESTGVELGRIECGLSKPIAVDINVPIDIATLQNCKVVKRDYVVRSEAVLPMPHKNIVLDIPVQIGPLYNAMPNTAPTELPIKELVAPTECWENMTDAVHMFTWE